MLLDRVTFTVQASCSWYYGLLERYCTTIGKDSSIQGAGGAERVSVSGQPLQDQALLTGNEGVGHRGYRGGRCLAAGCISVRLGGRCTVRSGQIIAVVPLDTGGEGATSRVPPPAERVTIWAG